MKRPRPVREAVEIADRWARFDAAHLRLREAEPRADDTLRYAAPAKKSLVRWMLAVRTAYQANVPFRKRPLEFFRVPESQRQLGRPQRGLMGPPRAACTQQASVVSRELRAAGTAVLRGTVSGHCEDLTAGVLVGDCGQSRPGWRTQAVHTRCPPVCASRMRSLRSRHRQQALRQQGSI